MEKGVLLIALGHTNYYRMAAVLAASLKDTNPGLPVCLATNSPVQPDHAELFDIIKPVPESMYFVNGKPEYIKVKLSMCDLSPFDKTLFLDVDQVIIPGKNIKPIFDILDGCNVTFSNTGLADISVWASIEEVKKLYGNKPFWNYHSEFVLFDKSEATLSYFKAAKKVYAANKIKSAERFAGATMADELAFQVAAMVTGIYPHADSWTPNFWFGRSPELATKYPYQLDGYLTYSIGGNQIPKSVKDNYNTLAKSYFAKLRLSNPYQVEEKRIFIPERNKY